MKLTAHAVPAHLNVEAIMAQWGIDAGAGPEDLWYAYVECSQCAARGPHGTAITQGAAVGVALGRWSEMVEWHRQSIALGKV